MYKGKTMLSIENKLDKKLKKSPGPKYDRLPVNIPVSYSFPVLKKKMVPDFKESHSIDISSNGIAILIVDVDDDASKKLSTPGQKIITRVEVPKVDGFVELGGSVKWVKTEKIKGNFQVITGIEFDETDYDKRLVLLSYALSMHRKQKIIRISTIILSVLLLCSAVWGFRTFVLKQEVEKKLEISEVNRNLLINEIAELQIKKNQIETRLQENENKINIQLKDLAKLTEDLDKTTKTLAGNRLLLAGFEEKFFDYVVVSDNEQIFVDKSSELSAFSNENYIKGNRALENRKYAEAVTYLKQFTKEKPDCSLGYSSLARALYRAGRESESREVFKKYQEVVYKRRN